MSGDVHTEPAPDGWAVREEGGKAVSFRTRREAVERGRQIASRNRSEHLIHDQGGSIGQSDSYSKDPFPRRRG